MTDRYLVLFLAPASVLEAWRRTDPAARQPAEQKMQEDWRRWMQDHAEMKVELEAVGATKLVTLAGASETVNDVMLCGFIEAPSHEAAASAFESHPHLRIPQASIQIMPVRPLRGM